jgi:hypothetical protein
VKWIFPEHLVDMPHYKIILIYSSFAKRSQSDIAIILTEHSNLSNLPLSLPGSRRMTGETAEMLDLIVSRRPSGILQNMKPPVHMMAQKRLMLE